MRTYVRTYIRTHNMYIYIYTCARAPYPLELHVRHMYRQTCITVRGRKREGAQEQTCGKVFGHHDVRNFKAYTHTSTRLFLENLLLTFEFGSVVTVSV